MTQATFGPISELYHAVQDQPTEADVLFVGFAPEIGAVSVCPFWECPTPPEENLAGLAAFLARFADSISGGEVVGCIIDKRQSPKPEADC